MKKISTDLYNLIKSLSKSEKRYFHRFASRHVLGAKNNYLSLFEFIKKQSTYNEEEVKQNFEGEKFAQYFSVAKRQLYNYLLDSLHEFHASKSSEDRIQRLIHQAEILLQKGLMFQSHRLIKIAKKKARSTANYSLLFQILRMERSILAKMGFSKLKAEDIEAIYLEEAECLAIMQNESTYHDLLWQVYHQHARRGTARSSDELDKLAQLTKHPLLEHESMARTFIARLNFHQIWATLHFMQGQVAKAKVHNQSIIALFHQDTKKIIELPARYFSSLKNYLVDCLVQGQHEEIDLTIQYIRQEIEGNAYKGMARLKVEVFCVTYTLQLNSYINQGHFDECKALLEEVEDGLNTYSMHISKKEEITFYHLLAYIYFGIDDHRRALRWVNHILNDNEKHLLQHVYAFARLLNLMIHFELGNFDILMSLIRTSSRYLQKVDQLYEIERLFIKQFQKILDAPLGEQQEVWQTLLDKLLHLREQSAHRQLLQYFNPIPWLRAKIEGKRFADVVRRG